ncbi:RNA polymerase sigma factor [Klebsormidium nitens]|uniref:RNA polymerase sigma factor n=1 Tax=Klebsormidium nitens TaxID=105231 RepID=A0A1Y1IPU2_KLENI|nr:RNA polymerase sigma factor [Klebsormidium nitens]|eukprot:GAQ90158.1 RNA polymerase sigma factor [Klebsormidium nitens]
MSVMASAQISSLDNSCYLRKTAHPCSPSKCAPGGIRVCCLHAVGTQSGEALRSSGHGGVPTGPPPLPAEVVDWRHAAAGRQPAQRRRVEPLVSRQPPLEERSKCAEVTGSEAATMAVYKEWVRRGEHRDTVWQDGTVRLGDRLVRIRNGRVSVVAAPAAPSEKVQALVAAAAPATQTLVQRRVRRQQASTARLRELLQERARQYERSAEAAARRDGADQTGTATHLHLLLACYPRLTLPQEKKFSRRVLAYHALRAVRDELEVRLQRSPSDEEWSEASELSSVGELRRRVEQGVAAKCRLVEGNLRLAVSVAQSFPRVGLDLEDLVQAGIVGLLKAVDRYDVRRGFRFSTYATYWIRQSIQATIRQDSRLVRLPAYAWDRLSKIAKARALLLVQLGRPATLAETAAAVRLSEGAVRLLLAASQEVVSLESGGPALLQRSLASGERVADWADKLADPDCHKDPYEMLAQEGAPHDIERLLCKLEAEEARVLELRLGLRGQPVHNLAQTSKLASVRFAKVAKLQNTAIAKLRGPFKKDVEDLLVV